MATLDPTLALAGHGRARGPAPGARSTAATIPPGRWPRATGPVETLAGVRVVGGPIPWRSGASRPRGGEPVILGVVVEEGVWAVPAIATGRGSGGWSRGRRERLRGTRERLHGAEERMAKVVAREPAGPDASGRAGTIVMVSRGKGSTGRRSGGKTPGTAGAAHELRAGSGR